MGDGGVRQTICALASGLLPSAIAIIRLSGPDAPAILAAHLRSPPKQPRHATLTDVIASDGRVLDRGVAIWFPAPSSYTGEDVLELHLHGGRAVVDGVLAALCARDQVRLAEPGEFTRRAFEAGKLDLAEAEGVADLIDAETAGQRDQALRQLSGETSDRISGWRDLLVSCLALIEVMVDFPDEDDAPVETTAQVIPRLQQLMTEFDLALADEGVGERIRDGFRIALIGAPNAGKSSLLNRLARRDAAIVTDLPGTTRDVVEVRLVLSGQLAILADTAGLRETNDRIEQEGVTRARRWADQADLRLLVVDASKVDHAAASETYEGHDLFRPGDLVLLNKQDLAAPPGEFGSGRDPYQSVSRETLAVSARTGEGIDVLEARLSEILAAKVAGQPHPIVTRRRHREALLAARSALAAAVSGLEEGQGAELVAEDLRLATRRLGGLLGQVDVEEILGAVFAEFCIGK